MLFLPSGGTFLVAIMLNAGFLLLKIAKPGGITAKAGQ
jgi:hypothetical protein